MPIMVIFIIVIYIIYMYELKNKIVKHEYRNEEARERGRERERIVAKTCLTKVVPQT